MKLNGIAIMVPAVALAVGACAPEPAPPPDPIVRVDTVIQEVPPPLPEGSPATVCLATGQEVQIYISPGGDTLVGPTRVELDDLRGVAFAGDYAGDEPWFNTDEDIEFADHVYSQFGSDTEMDCDDLQIVGAYNGVNLFAESTADAPYEVIYVPVEPGIFQPYEMGVAAVRG